MISFFVTKLSKFCIQTVGAFYILIQNGVKTLLPEKLNFAFFVHFYKRGGGGLDSKEAQWVRPVVHLIQDHSGKPVDLEGL